MKVLVVKTEIDSRLTYSYSSVYENEEVWVFPERENIDLRKLASEWKNNKENFPKFYQYLEYNGGVLVNFDEFVR